MNDRIENRRIVVLGGGPGGYACAFLAADLGLETTLVDQEVNPGGVCLHRGCIPSKALLHAAKTIVDAAEAKKFGIHFGEPEIDTSALRAWKDEVVDKLTSGLSGLVKRKKIEYVRGRGRFLDGETLEVDVSNGESRRLRFRDAVIATGSEAMRLPDQPDDERIFDATRALDPGDEVPGSLLVIGGGYIGLELGSVYASLGTRVTLAEMTKGLLPGVDRDLVSVLQRRAKGVFDEILLGTKVQEMKPQKNGVMVTFEGGDGQIRHRYEQVLVAVGRCPRTSDIGLEGVGVEVDETGFVRVSPDRRTTVPNIRAIGDVAGVPMLAHKASYEGRVAAEAIAGRPTVYDPRAIPAIVFTDPEIAWCGLTEHEAREQGREIEVHKTPWGASGRAATLGRSTGVTKLILEPESRRILGVGLAGPGAGELIAEGVVAIEMAAVADDLRWCIHPHPTLSETLMETAEGFVLKTHARETRE